MSEKVRPSDMVDEFYEQHTRRCQVFKNGYYQDMSFQYLQKGDKFRLFESTGELVKDDSDNAEFIAVSGVYLIDGVLAINIKRIDEDIFSYAENK